jgi:predicted ArsR family transcriptional regulator
MSRGPKRNARRKHGVAMTVDEILLNALERGPVTVNDILKHLGSRVRNRLDKLRVRGAVVREGRGRAHREFTYTLLRPHRAVKALGEKGGGLSRAAKVKPEPPLPIAEPDLWRGARTKGR